VIYGGCVSQDKGRAHCCMMHPLLMFALEVVFDE
jgi:hypothetical protein